MRMRKNVLLKIFAVIISIFFAFNLNFVYAKELYENVEISEEISEQEDKGEEISDEETPEQKDKGEEISDEETPEQKDKGEEISDEETPEQEDKGEEISDEETPEQKDKGEEISDEETSEQEHNDSANIPIEVSIDAGEMRFDYIEGYEDKEGKWKISGNTIDFINYSSDYTYNINIELNMNSYYSDFFTVSEENFNISPGEEKTVEIMLQDNLIENFLEKNAGKAGSISISVSVIDELD